jgi:hypothetical protein
MNMQHNPYASPAEVKHDEPISQSAEGGDAALRAIALEFRRCAPWLLALALASSLVATFGAISSLINLQEGLPLGFATLAIAGLFALFAAMAWRLRAKLLELNRSPGESTLVDALLRTRMVYATASLMLVFPALALGAMVFFSLMLSFRWMT